jgi:hypothetical protein
MQHRDAFSDTAGKPDIVGRYAPHRADPRPDALDERVLRDPTRRAIGLVLQIHGE